MRDLFSRRNFFAVGFGGKDFFLTGRERGESKFAGRGRYGRAGESSLEVLRLPLWNGSLSRRSRMNLYVSRTCSGENCRGNNLDLPIVCVYALLYFRFLSEGDWGPTRQVDGASLGYLSTADKVSELVHAGQRDKKQILKRR